MTYNSTKRSSSVAEKLINNKTKISDGEISLFDYIGNDEMIANGARCSFGKYNKSPEENCRLIRFLMRNFHTSPFEQVSFSFMIHAPLFVADMFMKFKYSFHMLVPLDEFKFFFPDEIDLDQKKEAEESIKKIINTFGNNSINIFPRNLYVRLFWKIDLHNMFKFLKDAKTDEYNEKYLNFITTCVSEAVPFSYQAFCDYHKNGKSISKEELKEYVNDKSKILEACEKHGMTKMEINEFMEKIN